MTDIIERGTYEQARVRACEWAKRELAEHQVVVVGPGEWYCGKPGTGMGSFRVIERPGYLFFFGDLGDLVLERHSCHGMLSWANSAYSSPQYFCEKIVAGPRLAFYIGDAEKYLAEQLAGEDGDEDASKERAEAVADELLCIPESLSKIAGMLYDCTPEQWYRAWSDAGCDEPTDCCYPAPRALYAMEALAWLWRQVADDEAAAIAACIDGDAT